MTETKTAKYLASQLREIGLDTKSLEEEIPGYLDFRGTFHTSERFIVDQSFEYDPNPPGRCLFYADPKHASGGASKDSERIVLRLGEVLERSLCDCTNKKLLNTSEALLNGAILVKVLEGTPADECRSPVALARELTALDQNFPRVTGMVSASKSLSEVRDNVLVRLEERVHELGSKLRSEEMKAVTRRRVQDWYDDVCEPAFEEREVFFCVYWNTEVEAGMSGAVIWSYCRFRENLRKFFLVAPLACYRLLAKNTLGDVLSLSEEVDVSSGIDDATIEAAAGLWETSGPLSELGQAVEAAESCLS
jgi:hypothetical protein